MLCYRVIHNQLDRCTDHPQSKWLSLKAEITSKARSTYWSNHSQMASGELWIFTFLLDRCTDHPMLCYCVIHNLLDRCTDHKQIQTIDVLIKTIPPSYSTNRDPSDQHQTDATPTAHWFATEISKTSQTRTLIFFPPHTSHHTTLSHITSYHTTTP